MRSELTLKEQSRVKLSYGWGFLVFEDPPTSVEKSLRVLREVTSGCNSLIITVGDVVSRNFLAHTNVAIIDGKTRRRFPVTRIREAVEFRCVNKPGTISRECYETVKDALKRALEGTKALVFVDGEEDLLVLAALESCPDFSWIIYGHWKGFVGLIPCTPFFKRLAHVILQTDFEEQRLDKINV